MQSDDLSQLNECQSICHKVSGKAEKGSAQCTEEINEAIENLIDSDKKCYIYYGFRDELVTAFFLIMLCQEFVPNVFALPP